LTDRVLVFGLDGATLDLIEPWAAEGKLPTLRQLLESGAHGRLESTFPPVTSPAWPSFATGKNPGKHGVFDFITGGGARVGLVNSTSVDGPTLWDLLSRYGRRVGVMGVPVTYPPSQVNGFMITGILSPRGAEISYPPGFLAGYERKLGKYRVVPRVQYKPGNEDEFIADLADLLDTHSAFALRLAKEEPWDFLMIHFIALDIAQHALWRFMDRDHPLYDQDGGERYGEAIQELYRRVDRALGRILEVVGEDVTVVVMSDHGFGPLHGVVNLNNLLRKHGLLRLKRDPLTQAKVRLFEWGLTPANVYRALTRLGLQNITWKVSKAARNRVVGRFLSFDDVDWSRTKAYAMGHVGQIYVNLEGREPHGIVKPGEEYEAVCQQVIAVLHTLVHPVTGRPLVTEVRRKEETCFGKYADLGPDLHVVMDEYRYISFPLFATDNRIVTSQIRGDSGCHRLHGVLIISGPSVRAGQAIQGAKIIDLTPTILWRMGLPIPRDMDGVPLIEAFDPAFVAERMITYEDLGMEQVSEHAPHVLSAAEEDELKDRLRGLGYL